MGLLLSFEDIECMKAPYLGKMGNIAIGTKSVDRTVVKLTADGVEFAKALSEGRFLRLRAASGAGITCTSSPCHCEERSDVAIYFSCFDYM